MKSSDNINLGIEEFGLIADAQALAARLTGAKSSVEAKAIQGQLLGLISIAGNSGMALSEIMKALSSAGGKIVQLSSEEQDATYQRIMANRFLDADTKNLYNGIESFMTDEEKKYLDDIDPEKEYDVATFDENGNVNGSKKVQGYKLQEAFILLKANANKGALNVSQMESLNRKLYDNPAGPQGIADIIKGEGRLRDAADLFRGHLKASAADRTAAAENYSYINTVVTHMSAPGAKNTGGAVTEDIGGTLYKGSFGIAAVSPPVRDAQTSKNDTFSATRDIVRRMETPDGKLASSEEVVAAFEAIVENSDNLLVSTKVITADMVAARAKAAAAGAPAKHGEPKATMARPEQKVAGEKPRSPITAPQPLPSEKILVAGFNASRPRAAAHPSSPLSAPPSSPTAVAGDKVLMPSAESNKKVNDAMIKAGEIVARAEAATGTEAEKTKAIVDSFEEIMNLMDETTFDASGFALAAPPSVTVVSSTAPATLPAAPATPAVASKAAPATAVSTALMATPPVAMLAGDAGIINPAASSLTASGEPAPGADKQLAAPSPSAQPLPTGRRAAPPSVIR
jgi:hypothetical protein